MRNSWVKLVSLLAVAPAGYSAQAVQRFRPATANYVVLQLPAASEPTSRQLRTELKRAALEPDVAHRLAQYYLRLAHTTREQRYFGRAEAVLRPWIARSSTPSALLLLQADILQNRHDFSGARRLLDRALSQDPRETQAHLMRASVSLVQGNPGEARVDCAALMGSGETALGAICLAQVLAAMGQLERAGAMIELVLSRQELPDPATRAWAQTSLADIASRRGDSAAAEYSFRSALAFSPQDEYLRCALSDLLIARGAADEALALLDLPRPSVGMLVRRVLAQSVLGDRAARRATLAQLDELLRLEAQRGGRVHLREETLLALALKHPSDETLKLARANFAIQREPIDARLLARAATNARNASALQELNDWRLQSGFRDYLVDTLLARYTSDNLGPAKQWPATESRLSPE